MTRPRFVACVAGAAALALLLTGCLLDGTQPSVTETPDQPVIDTTGVDWEVCGNLECATVEVPLNWAEPDGETIEIAFNRHRARDASNRIGSLLINPGGPGGSGKDLTSYFVSIAGDDVVDRFDVVGFDPRGVGSSTPIDCGPADVIDAQYVADPILTTEAEVEAARAAITEFALNCRELSGPVIEYMDTVSAARDMDALRDALGDDHLHFLGYSYGTQLGATYAQLYPDNVGRIVLDGAVDFLLPAEEISEGQALGFEAALTNYVEWCQAERDCPLVDGTDAARAQIRDITLTARDQGYPAGGQSVNGNLMVYGVVVTLYDEASWPFLTIALTEVIERGEARTFLELANFYLDRSGQTGEYQSNSTIAFTAVNCLARNGDEGLYTLAELQEYQRDAEELSPTFGWWFGSGLGCDGWPWVAGERITDLSAAADAAPMLVVGTTDDPATPFEWSESLAERLDASLLVYEGDGHTAYGRSNQCVTDVVDAYLVSGELPSSGTRC